MNDALHDGNDGYGEDASQKDNDDDKRNGGFIMPVRQLQLILPVRQLQLVLPVLQLQVLLQLALLFV